MKLMILVWVVLALLVVVVAAQAVQLGAISADAPVQQARFAAPAAAPPAFPQAAPTGGCGV